MRYRHALRSIAESNLSARRTNTAGFLGFVKVPGSRELRRVKSNQLLQGNQTKN
jgi:hypothetical protein